MNNNYVVYRHTSPSGKVYIGITKVTVKSRWRKGHGYTNNHCYKFANAIRKYGWDNIKHEVLLTNLSKSEAMYSEKYLIRWYKLHNISYNILDGGEIGGSLTGKDHPMYGRHETNPMYGRKGKDNPQSIKVYQYTRDGIFIKAWNGISEAAASFHNEASAKTSIVQCCKYHIPTCNGYIWRYFYKDKLEENAPMHNKQVYQYDVYGNLIGYYNKITDACVRLGVSERREGIISMCCMGKAVSGLGYFWSLTKYDKYPIQNVKPQVITKMKKYIKQKNSSK